MTKTWDEISEIINNDLGITNFLLLVSHQECQILYEAAIRLKAKTILELGLGCGTFTTTLLFACKELGAHLTTIDINKNFAVGNPKIMDFAKKLKLDGNWTFIENSDENVDWDTPVDMLVLDTDHTLDLTVKELDKFMPFVTGEAFLHDVLHQAHKLDINTAVLNFIRKNQPSFSWYLVNLTRADCWNYQIFNTWCGIGRLYKEKMEGSNSLYEKKI